MPEEKIGPQSQSAVSHQRQRQSYTRSDRRNQRANLTHESATTASRGDTSRRTAQVHSTVKKRPFIRVEVTGRRFFWVMLVDVGVGV